MLVNFGSHHVTLSSSLDAGARKGQYFRSLVFPSHGLLASLGGRGAPGIERFNLPEYEGWRGGGVGTIALVLVGRKVGRRAVELLGGSVETALVKDGGGKKKAAGAAAAAAAIKRL